MNFYFARLKQTSYVSHHVIGRLQILYLILVTLLFTYPNLKESCTWVTCVLCPWDFTATLNIPLNPELLGSQLSFLGLVFHQSLSMVVQTCLTGLSVASSITGIPLLIKSWKKYFKMLEKYLRTVSHCSVCFYSCQGCITSATYKLDSVGINV